MCPLEYAQVRMETNAIMETYEGWKHTLHCILSMYIIESTYKNYNMKLKIYFSK